MVTEPGFRNENRVSMEFLIADALRVQERPTVTLIEGVSPL
jgi:hypothetical protein